MKKIFLTSAILCLAGSFGFTAPAAAQNAQHEIVVVEPLFDYPSPPEEMQNLRDRSDYVMAHFWDKLDVKNKTAVDQNALNHAFETYSVAMQWADAGEVTRSTDALIKRIEKNPVLLLQMARAAEEALYGPRASMWIDDVYIRYAGAVVRNKKIDSNRKMRYERQISSLENSMTGKKAPEFSFTRPDGRSGKYFPMATPTVLYFGDPDCFDCRMGKLKLDTDLEFSELVNEGKLNVVYIVPDPEDGWEAKVADYNPKWAVGSARDIDTLYDLRLTPSIFIIDSKGTIRFKNITPEEAVKQAVIITNETD